MKNIKKLVLIGTIGTVIIMGTSCQKQDITPQQPQQPDSTYTPGNDGTTKLSYHGSVMKETDTLYITKKIGDFTLDMKNISGEKTITCKILNQYNNVVRTFAPITVSGSTVQVPYEFYTEKTSYKYAISITTSGEDVGEDELNKVFPVKWQYSYRFQEGGNIVLGSSSGNVTIVGNDSATRTMTVQLIDGSTTSTIVNNITVSGANYTVPVSGLVGGKIYILQVKLDNGLYVLQTNIRA